jgi:hypothetical protein
LSYFRRFFKEEKLIGSNPNPGQNDKGKNYDGGKNEQRPKGAPGTRLEDPKNTKGDGSSAIPILHFHVTENRRQEENRYDAGIRDAHGTEEAQEL